MLYRHKQGTFEVYPYKATYNVAFTQQTKDETSFAEKNVTNTEHYKLFEVTEILRKEDNETVLYERTNVETVHVGVDEEPVSSTEKLERETEDEEGNMKPLIQYKEIIVEELVEEAYAIVTWEENRESYVHDKEMFENTLENGSQPYKDLVYENFSLTTEEEGRYKQVRSLPESSIGSVIAYVKDGTFPEGNDHALRNIQLEKENAELKMALIEQDMGSNAEMNELKMALLETDMQIATLKGSV